MHIWNETILLSAYFCQPVHYQYYFFMPHLNRVVLAQQRAVLVSRRWWETADWTLAPKAPQWTESHRQPVHGREHWGPPECGPSLCKSRTRVIARKDPCKVQPEPFEPINSYFIKLQISHMDFSGTLHLTDLVVGHCKTPERWAGFSPGICARLPETGETAVLRGKKPFPLATEASEKNHF